MGSPFFPGTQASPLFSVPSSDHDDRWETKEAVSPAPEAPQPTPPEETPTQVRRAVISGQGAWGCSGPTPSPRPALCSPQPLETPAPPAHRPPEDEGEEVEGEEDEGEDEEWEDVSEEEEEEEIEEEEEADEKEEEPAQDHQPQEAEPTGSPTRSRTGSPTGEQADKEQSGPEEPPPLPQAPATPSSPFSPPGDHQPVSDWGEEMELNSPRDAHPASALSAGEAWPFGNA